MVTQNAIDTDKPIQVTKGGTGVITLADHGVLLGSGTGDISVTGVGATDTALIGNTGADPTYSGTPTVTSISFGDEGLDAYDEGTWTPVLAFGGASVGVTYGIQTGEYLKVGDLVWVNCQMVLTSKGVSVGIATISGLPFQVGYATLAVMGRWSGINLTGGFTAVTARFTNGTSIVTVEELAANNFFLPVQNTQFNNANQIYFAAIYKVT